MAKLTYAQVADLLKYEPETGNLFWKERPLALFNSSRIAKSWNAKFAGKEAFTSRGGDGHKRGRIANRGVKAHHVAWLLATGEWPKQVIDHINGDTADNRFANLRDVPRSINQKNVKKRKNKGEGISGVSFDKSRGRWHSCITVNGKHHFLGRFKEMADAEAARMEAQRRFGFSDRHGASSPI